MSIKNIVLSTGSKMPSIGLGTWQAEDPLQLKEAMEVAFQNGYRHFDTAYLYSNENIIGKVIERWISRGIAKREELFITTKLPLSGVHPDRVEMFLNKSLKSLGLDYVDLYLIHFPICLKYDELNPFPVDETGKIQAEPTDLVAVWKKMEDLVYSGKVKAIGLSNFSKDQIVRILEHATIKPANLQVEVYLYFQNVELVNFCKEKGISVVAYSPLGTPGYNNFAQSKGYPPKKLPDVMSDPALVSVAKKHYKTPAQIMLRFLVQNEIAAIPKSTNPGRIKENISIFDFELDEHDMKILRSLDKGTVARIIDCKDGYGGMDEHPEFPFN